MLCIRFMNSQYLLYYYVVIHASTCAVLDAQIAVDYESWELLK